MIKKILTVLLTMAICFVPVSVQAQEQDLTPNAAASILMEASSKQILHSKNEVEKLYPASTTKIMTMILLFEAINSDKISWDDVITTSEYASSMGGSQIYLEPGEKMSVKDMFKAIAIASANDASVAVGEFIGGTIQGFIDMMNEKGKDLGLVNTHFVNATGLHDDNHYTCALDLALMAAYLLDIGGEELLDVTSLYDSYIREDSQQSFWLVNTNKLLKLYDGVDGLKTGYTKEAKYCLVTTVERDGLRLIGVVMQAEEPKVRNQEMTQLLDFGYNSYNRVTLFAKEEEIDQLEINNSEKKFITIISHEDVIFIQDKNNEKEMKYEIIYDKTIPPIAAGEKIGTLNIFLDDTVVASYDLFSNEDVGMLTFFQKTIRTLLDLI